MQLQDTTRLCELCGAAFTPTWKPQRFCSRACGYANRKIDRGLTCLHCGKAYEPKMYDRVTFCSRPCALAHRTAGSKREADRRRAVEGHGACVICGGVLTRQQQKTCSRACRLEHNRLAAQRFNATRKPIVERVCKECGIQFIPEYGDKREGFCGERCLRRCYKRIAKAVRRARTRGVVSESINPVKVFDRDGWRCQLCGKPTPKDKRGSTHSRAPELDHIIPIARGGSHTWANVQCLCRACNQAKSDRLPGQLRLMLS